MERNKERVRDKRKQKVVNKTFDAGSFVRIKNEAADQDRGKKLKRAYDEVMVVVEDKN